MAAVALETQECCRKGCINMIEAWLTERMARAGAKVNMLVKEVITNTSGFERIQSDSAMDLSAHSNSKTDDSFMGADLALINPGKQDSAARSSSHRMVVHPHFPYDSGVSHGCKLCPANLCKVWTQGLLRQ